MQLQVINNLMMMLTITESFYERLFVKIRRQLQILLMASTPEQGFQNFSAPTPAAELAIFLLWLRLRIFLS